MEEAGLTPYATGESEQPPVQDDPALIATLNQHIAKIEQMDADRAALFQKYGNDATSRFYNMWPLYIAVYKMAIKLIMLLNDRLLSQSKYNAYKYPLSNINLGSPPLLMDQKKETMDTLIHLLRSAMKMDAVVQKDLDDDRNEKQAARLSVLTGKGGNKSRKKSKQFKSRTKRNTNPRATNRHAVATAIKDIPLAKARADFAALKAVPCPDINQAAKIGNAAMDHYFFRHRLATKTKRDISYYNWIKINWQSNESEHRFYKFNLAQGKTPEKARYAVFRLYYGAIHGFKPLVAKWMYCTYKPRIAVLDFSAGWGGRCLGAMSLGIPYIGIDTNVDLRPAYERMAQELDPQGKVTMRFHDAAATDFSKFKYDMVFTSPPYFKTVRPIEGYAHMPHYADRADFNARFLFPVVRKTYAHMARGGTYALNIPDDMYDEIKAAAIMPPKLHAKHRLFIQPRFAKGNPNHTNMQYKEHIYVWKKP